MYSKSILSGLGTPAKATTILNYFGISDDHLEFTNEDNTLKQNKFIPGTGVEIKGINDIDTSKYDYVIVLAWNFYETIKQNTKKVFPNSKYIKLK